MAPSSSSFLSSSSSMCRDVCIIRFSESSSNPLHPLGASLRRTIYDALQQAQRDPSIRSIVLLGSPHNFSAGADLQELSSASSTSSNTSLLVVAQDSSSSSSASSPSSPPSSSSLSLLDVIRALDECSKPTIALITGSCLGGGLELALACHHRVAAESAKLGLPEVHVGVIPGAGGTQRLPRLIGLQNALQLILTGATVPAKRARQLGLVDEIIITTTDTSKSNDDTALTRAAIQWARWAETLPLRRVSQLPIRESLPQAHVMMQMAQLSLPKQGSDGMMAALTAIRACVNCQSDFEQGMQVETQQFLQTLTSSQGRARRHAFFAVRTAQKMETNSNTPTGSHPLLQKDVSKIHTAVIGAGTMGAGIALVLLQTGFQVTLVDVQEQALVRGMSFLHKTMETYQKRGKLHPTKAKDMKQRLHSTMYLQDLSKTKLVVEAVVEKMQIKQNIFKTLKQVAPSALLVSNTSTLDIDAMGAAAGWHFFSPAHVMKLVEIVHGKHTQPETVAVLQVLTKRIGKIGVVVGNCDGFCGNRMLKPYQAETTMLLVEPQSQKKPPTIQQIDVALLNFGMALGPFQLSDLAGNDVGYNIRKERGWVRLQENDPEPNNRPSRYTELPDVMVAQFGRNGQKSGKGWYDYNPNIGQGRKGLVSKEMDDLLVQFSSPIAHASRMEMSDEEIIERVLFPLVNEGFKCLEEGIARRPSDIDVIYLYGYGFPAWRGGPMYWAENEIGLQRLLQTLQQSSNQFPSTEHFVPSKLLQTCVQRGLTVEDYCHELSQTGHSRL